MKYLKKFLILYQILAIGSLAFAYFAVLPGYLKKEIEKKASIALGSSFTVVSVKPSLIPKVGLSLRGVRTTWKAKPITADEINAFVPLSFDLFKKKLFIEMELTKPSAELEITESANSPTTPPSSEESVTIYQLSPELQKTQMGILFVIREGSVKIQKGGQSYSFQNTNLNVRTYGFDQPFNLTFQSRLDLDLNGIKLSSPLEIEASAPFSLNEFAPSSMTVKFLSMGLSARGKYNLSTQELNWILDLEAPDLAKIPAPSEYFKGAWAGSLMTSLHLTGGGASRPIQATGKVEAHNLKLPISIKQNSLQTTGLAQGDLDVRFKYEGALQLEQLQANLNLDEFGIEYKELFKKPIQTPFKIKTLLSGSSSLIKLQEANIQLAQLNANLNGTIGLAANSEVKMNFHLVKSNLAGLEKLFPILEKQPLTGEIEASVQIDGSRADLDQMYIKVESLNLNQVSAHVSYQNEKIKLDGPVTLNAQNSLQIKNNQIQSAKLVGQFDLSNLAIHATHQAKDMLQKPAPSPLTIRFQAEQNGNSLLVKNLSLSSQAFLVALAGTIHNPKAPSFNLKLQLTQLDFLKLSQLVPLLKPYSLTGNAKANLSLSGNWDFAGGIEKSPLKLTGETSVTIPKFVYNPPPAEKKGEEEKGTSKVAAPAPEALAPQWPIIQNMQLSSMMNLQELEFKQMKMQNIKAKAIISNGNLKMMGDIQSLFGGSVKLKDLQISLLQPQPTTQIQSTVQNMDLGQALNWASHDFKGLAAGKATGDFAISAAHPSRKDFLNATTASGKLKITDGFISTLKFDQMAKEKVSKIPGVGSQFQPNSKGVAANIFTDFNYAKEKLAFQNFQIITPEKNELKMAGVAGMDKKIDFTGKIFLTNAPVSGSVREHNSDSQGRLILDAKVTGEAFSPQLNLMETTVQSLIKRTAEGESKKLQSQIQKQATEKAQQEVQNLKNQAGDQLKKLFGK